MAELPRRPFSGGHFPEYDALQALIARAGPSLRCDVIESVRVQDRDYPIQCLELGSTDPQNPAIGFFGGVHGLERIGTQVLLSFLQSLIARLQWDETLGHILDRLRLVFVPLVNPGGMRLHLRSNPQGIDLMRNAPVEADPGAPWPLGGQRLTRHIPWYRGPAGAPMAAEARALCAVVEQRLLPHRFSLSVDCHSGFGLRDRIWFPYARTPAPIDCLAEIYALRTLFRTTHPYHSIYVIEPQARHYTTHGDLWDYLYDRSRAGATGLFLPLTLELGSWLWIKKSPGQLFSMLGMFNPLAPHRQRRILRTHLTLFDFLCRAAASHERWLPTPAERATVTAAAREHWYGNAQTLPAPGTRAGRKAENDAEPG